MYAFTPIFNPMGNKQFRSFESQVNLVQVRNSGGKGPGAIFGEEKK